MVKITVLDWVFLLGYFLAMVSIGITVAYATQDPTATAGADYIAVSDSIQLTHSQPAQYVNVTVLGDNIYELNELFTVELSPSTNSPRGVARGVWEGSGTILNDDTAPT